MQKGAGGCRSVREHKRGRARRFCSQHRFQTAADWMNRACRIGEDDSEDAWSGLATGVHIDAGIDNDTGKRVARAGAGVCVTMRVRERTSPYHLDRKLLLAGPVSPAGDDGVTQQIHGQAQSKAQTQVRPVRLILGTGQCGLHSERGPWMAA